MNDNQEQCLVILTLSLIVIIGLGLSAGAGIVTYKMVWAIERSRNTSFVSCPPPKESCIIKKCKDVRPCPAMSPPDCEIPPSSGTCRGCPQSCSVENCKQSKCLPQRPNYDSSDFVNDSGFKKIDVAYLKDQFKTKTVLDLIKETRVKSLERLWIVTQLLELVIEPNLKIISRKLCNSNPKEPTEGRTTISDGDYVVKQMSKETNSEGFVEEENHHDVCTMCQDRYKYLLCVMETDFSSGFIQPKRLSWEFDMNIAAINNNNNLTQAENYAREAWKFGVQHNSADKNSKHQFGLGNLGDFIKTTEAFTFFKNDGTVGCRLCSEEASLGSETRFKDDPKNTEKTEYTTPLQKFIWKYFVGDMTWSGGSKDWAGTGAGCLRKGHFCFPDKPAAC